MDSLLALLPERIDLILAPFQSGGYMFFHPLRVSGPPEGLDEAIRSWAETYTEQLVEDVVRLHCRSCGALRGRAGSTSIRAMNAWHFPLADEAFLERMARRGIPGTRCRPGLCFRVEASKVEAVSENSGLVTVTLRSAFGSHLQPLPCG